MRYRCRRTISRPRWALAATLAVGLGLVAGCSSEPAPKPTVPPPSPPAADQPAPETPPAPQAQVPPGPVRTADTLAAFLGAGFKPAEKGNWGLERSQVVADPSAPGGRLLRVSFPKGSASPQAARKSHGPEGGTQVYAHFPQSGDALTLTYNVRFQPGFQFVKGGKLPGLFGGSAGSGGEHKDDGFSTRFMWRTNGAGEVYAYLPGTKGDNGYGDSLGRGSWTFQPGKWTKITQRVQLNTPGQKNGSVTVWLDGKQVFQKADLDYRSSGGLHIDGVFFSTFFGGSDVSWASPVNQTIDFAGFTVGNTAP
ncbi:polysaccharide lyase [Pseudonocardia acaciae]|uniref:polysaccharide lyase n=1 Tax=Pseudonocardia acaciae TaxID=551276 RepID=UPI0007E8D0E5|nr:heparin lyase I family protein [Pseudonocardia acaciae]